MVLPVNVPVCALNPTLAKNAIVTINNIFLVIIQIFMFLIIISRQIYINFLNYPNIQIKIYFKVENSVFLN